MTGPTFLYDGDCAFCSSCARFVSRRVRPAADVIAWQRADLEALGMTAAECDTAVQWIGADATHSAGSRAIAEMLRAGGRPWRMAGRLLGVPPVPAVAEPIYRWVAAHRDRMPGGTPTCALPAADRDGRR